jgi:hypothetical protein
MIRGYGNLSEPTIPERDDLLDQPHPRRSITQKILATLPAGIRDTPANRRMAKRNGWTDEEFQSWVNGEGEADAGVRDG